MLGGTGEGSPGTGADRPPYRAACEGMGFGELLRFVEGRLQALRSEDGDGDGVVDGPHSEEEFLDLLELLRAKAGEGPLPDDGEPPGRPPGPSGRFVPSEDLRALREECGRYRDEAARYRREGKPGQMARFQERRAERCRERADAWEAEERQEHDVRRRAGSSGRRETHPTNATLAPDLSGTVRRVERDIEHAFRPGGPIFSIGDLPWELLPPGQLTGEGVRAYYEGLARAYPERGYLPERIVKARSLGPSWGWKGTGGFRGYMVFEFPGTEKVLLECPRYGNAIYVLGSDWRGLSRKSKGAVLAGEGTVRIPHVGGWFGRTKRALGIR